MDVPRSRHPRRRLGMAPPGRARGVLGAVLPAVGGVQPDPRAGRQWSNRPHDRARSTLEKLLFLGKVPNNVLQDRFYVPNHVQWWEAITGVTYMSHFFVVYVTAAVLFLRSREQFIRWMTALVLLTVFGLLGYWLFPMAPPWMAADELHLIPDPSRPGARGLRAPPPDLRRPALDPSREQRRWEPGGGDALTHAGTRCCLGLRSSSSAPRRLWVKVLLALYPLLMAFTLVFGGEHYMIDILARLAAGRPGRRAERPLPRTSNNSRRGRATQPAGALGRGGSGAGSGLSGPSCTAESDRRRCGRHRGFTLTIFEARPVDLGRGRSRR